MKIINMFFFFSLQKMNINLSIYESYQKEIFYLQKHGGILLQKIKNLQIKMNQRKQQKLYPTGRDLQSMQKWVVKFLRMLAYIKTYQFFQGQNMVLADQNTNWFFHIFNHNYEILFRSFMVKLNQLQSVDFTIIS